MFSIESLNKRVEEGKMNIEEAEEMSLFYKQDNIRRREREESEEFSKNNLEYDLRSTDWIVEKAKSSAEYSQNLYAALCNNTFLKVNLENTPENITKLLKDGTPQWSCSWRYAGGIIADVREEGDYIDWYCSGIRNHDEHEKAADGRSYVNESVVTDEVREDLLKLGWIVERDNDDD